jgi:hypothetical protein
MTRHKHNRKNIPILIETPRDQITKRRCLKKREKQRCIIARTILDGVEYALHATKGYRAMRE